MPLSPEAKRRLATMTRDDAEYFVMMAERIGLAGPEVEAAYEFLRRVYRRQNATTSSDRGERDTPSPPPGWEEPSDAVETAPPGPSPFDEFPDADAEPATTLGAVAAEDAGTEDVQVSPIEWLLEQEPYRRRYVRVPLALIHGEIGALLEKTAPGCAWLLVVLLSFADRRDRIISASKLSIRTAAGIADDRTLDRRLAVLCTGKPALGLPPLLRVLRGPGPRFAFRADGLAALVQLAQRTVADREARFAAIRKARSQGGQAAMQRRWEKSR